MSLSDLGFRTLVAFAAIALAGGPALAVLNVYDGFERSFPVYAAGGLGFDGAWTQGGFNVVAANYGLTERSLGNRRLATRGVAMSGTAQPGINGAVRDLEDPLGQDNTVTYLSVLLRPEGVLNEGAFGGFFGVTLNGNQGSDLFVGKPGAGALEQWVVETRGGGGQVPSGTSTVVGETVLLVLRAEFLNGNDVFTLHVNPPPTSAEPNDGVIKDDLDLGLVPRLGIYSTGGFTVDEIRLGDTYEDVLPRH